MIKQHLTRDKQRLNQAHLSLSVELARAELEAAQKKFEKAQLQLQRFNEIISN